MATIEIKNQGDYLGEFSFLNDTVGEEPADWTIVNGDSDVSTLVYRSFNQHLQILRFSDQSNAVTTAWNYFTKTSGTIEFYMAIDEASSQIRMFLKGTGGSTIVEVLTRNDEVQYWDDVLGDYRKLDDAVDGTWYRFRVDFDCVGEYDAPTPYVGTMGADTFNLYLYDQNNNLLASTEDEAFHNVDDSIASIRFQTSAVSYSPDKYAYVDAVDFSWSSGWTLGRNASLVADVDITSDVIDMKITTEIGKIPKGTTRIKSRTFEEDDIIQVTDIGTSWQNGRGMYKDSLNFRDDTLGSAPAQTGQGTWTEDHGTSCDSFIIDKYNKHRYVLQIQDYDGVTFIYDGDPDDFNDEDVGDSGVAQIDWLDVMAGTDGNIAAVIVANEDNHSKVLKFTSDGDNGADATYTHNVNSAIDTYEFWYKYIDNGQAAETYYIYLQDGVGTLIYGWFNCADNKFRIVHGNGAGANLTVDCGVIASDTWCHMKYTFNCTTDTYSFWLNGDLKVDDETFYNDRDSAAVTKFLLFNYDGDNLAIECYMDAWGEDSDAGYSTGDNLTPSTPKAKIYHDFGVISSQTSGTIELWVATTDPTYETLISITEDTPTTQIQIRIDADSFDYDDGDGAGGESWTQLFASPLIGAWYRVLITFDHSTDTYSLQVWNAAGSSQGSVSGKGYTNNGTNCTRIYFESKGTDADYFIFIDRIGYSWDTSYTVGDNANLEVILASQTIFEGQITSKDRKYVQKLNLINETEEIKQSVGEETAEVTVTADYTPNMINDLLSNYNHLTATEQDEIYRGTYNFLNDSNTAIPFGVLDDSEGTGTMEVLTASLGSHKNYIHMDHADDNHGAFKIFFEAQTSGVIEWFVRTTSVATGMTEMFFYDSGGVVKIKLTIQGSKHKWYDGVALTNGSAAAVNIWYHYRLSFDCTTDTFSLWVDGNPEAVDADFFAVSTDIAQLRCEANHDVGNPSFDSYIDAYGFSWDWRYPECRTYTAASDPTDTATYINKQILVDEIEPSTYPVAGTNIVLAGDTSGEKVIKDHTDKENWTHYILPTQELVMNDAINDSQIDFSSSDKIWAVVGKDRVQRVNKVLVKGGIQVGPPVIRLYGEANNTDSQTTYGVKAIEVYVGEIYDQTELDTIATNILNKYENASDQVNLWRDMTTEGMMQVGETITISASDIRYNGNITEYITAGQWIISKIDYYPITGRAKIILIDSLLFVLDEEEVRTIEKLLNAQL